MSHNRPDGLTRAHTNISEGEDDSPVWRDGNRNLRIPMFKLDAQKLPRIAFVVP